jgi:hypothetical protein
MADPPQIDPASPEAIRQAAAEMERVTGGKVSAAAMEAFWTAGAEAWHDVPNAGRFTEELRGDEYTATWTDSAGRLCTEQFSAECDSSALQKAYVFYGPSVIVTRNQF